MLIGICIVPRHPHQRLRVWNVPVSPAADAIWCCGDYCPRYYIYSGYVRPFDSYRHVSAVHCSVRRGNGHGVEDRSRRESGATCWAVAGDCVCNGNPDIHEFDVVECRQFHEAECCQCLDLHGVLCG